MALLIIGILFLLILVVIIAVAVYIFKTQRQLVNMDELCKNALGQTHVTTCSSPWPRS